MTFETIGCTIEGLAVPYHPAGVLLLLASPQAPHTTPLGAWAIPRAIIAPPNLSTIALDPLTGDVKSGALSVSINATPELCRLLARQARARKIDASLVLNTTPGATTMTLAGTIAIGDLLYIDDELIFVYGFAGGSVWQVDRGYGDTLAAAHRAGTNMYKNPPYWIGRAVTLYKTILSELGYVLTTEAIWRGYLTEPPAVGQEVTSITLKAEDSLAALRRSMINRAPLRHIPTSPLVPYRATDGQALLTGYLPAETDRAYDTSVHRRLTQWIANDPCKALMIGKDHLVITVRDNIISPGRALLGSKPFVYDEEVKGDIYEVALWDPRLDEWLQDKYGYDGVAPTIRCEYPYHPLTIAAALLFSDPYESDEDALSFNVMHESCTLGIAALGNLYQWDLLIRKTAHLRVDRCLLFAGGEPLAIFDFITKQLLPAYGFLLAQDAAGLLRPIQTGLTDVGEFATSPLVVPISGSWEWALSSHGALDAIEAVIGDLPWQKGRAVEVSALGARNPSSGSRSTRMSRASAVVANYPTINAATTENYGATVLANLLAWRYDGLPTVTCMLQATQPWYLGQVVRIAKPDGLVSPILFDADGVKVDTLWETATLLGQIVSLRRDLVRNRYEVELLLANYGVARYAKWRAPAARIKARPVVGGYVIEGTASDFDEPVSDALSLTVGDALVLMTSSLGYKGGSSLSRTITAITPYGASDWLVTLNADFSFAGAAGDWLYLAYSFAYSNLGVVGVDLYPYVWQSSGATLVRPGGGTTPADEYS